MNTNTATNVQSATIAVGVAPAGGSFDVTVIGHGTVANFGSRQLAERVADEIARIPVACIEDAEDMQNFCAGVASMVMTQDRIARARQAHGFDA